MKKNVCHNCIGESFLNFLILNTGTKLNCTYCKQVDNAFTLDDIAGRVHNVFNNFYRATNDEPEDWQYTLLKDKESTYEWDREGDSVEDIVCDILDADNSIAIDIAKILSDKHYDYELAKMSMESPYSEDSKYERKELDGKEFKNKWAQFEARLKNSSRYFGHNDFLNEIFRNINQLAKDRHSRLIVDIGPDNDISTIYRARIIHPLSEIQKALVNPELGLGPPPQNLSKAGRMNARGIAVLYGALTSETAISEIRPPVGADVLVGSFDILNPLRVLDTEALKAIEVEGSLFDSQYFEDLELCNFFNQLSYRLSKPVMPDDEPFEYLATQVISDFLSTNTELNIHGILYPSVYMGGKGKNIVIFSTSVIIEKNTNETTFQPPLDDEEGRDQYDYITILEEVPDGIQKNFGLEWDEIEERYRIPKKPTLKLDRDSLVLCNIESVEVRLNKNEVKRQVIKAAAKPKERF